MFPLNYRKHIFSKHKTAFTVKLPLHWQLNTGWPRVQTLNHVKRDTLTCSRSSLDLGTRLAVRVMLPWSPALAESDSPRVISCSLQPPSTGYYQGWWGFTYHTWSSRCEGVGWRDVRWRDVILHFHITGMADFSPLLPKSYHCYYLNYFNFDCLSTFRARLLPNLRTANM